MKLVVLNLFLFIVLTNGKPQVPYDYIPLGREARRQVPLQPHPSDVNLNYERLFPARRKWID
ncbi:hypothetical protein O3G_MSEX014424 [Manduca sexta]|uniref:Uncharacterized protein n=1 Tax=Manduca sexta TaxID=7130 RepID=A0A922CZC1_MANSE|nr:hypothetical protein O3G_MSEX014424 [Manduca sexta]